MKYFFHPGAVLEFNETINYYEECRPGLGAEFANEIYSTISRIIQYPKAWSRLSQNTRKCLTNRFPFGVIYQEKEGRIFILAVMHLNKEPTYWKDRTKK